MIPQDPTIAAYIRLENRLTASSFSRAASRTRLGEISLDLARLRLVNGQPYAEIRQKYKSNPKVTRWRIITAAARIVREHLNIKRSLTPWAKENHCT